MESDDTFSESAFSDQLEHWLRADGPKTLGSLGEVFGEKSFAVTILLLMFVPALPLPTGGITHVFEGITVVVAAQMVLGRRTLLLPKRWQRREPDRSPRIGRSRTWCDGCVDSSGSRGLGGGGSSAADGACGSLASS